MDVVFTLQDVTVNLPASPPASPAVTACLLVIHGSRDPRSGIAAQQLAHQVSQQLSGSSLPIPLVDVACLELAPLPLHQQIVAFGDRARQWGCTALAIVPLFLLPGVHVCKDIPEEVGIAQTMLDNRLTIQLWPYLGQASGIVEILAHQLQSIPQPISQTISQNIPPTSILLAHGSRRVGGNQPVEAIATHLHAVPAYWAVPPSLDNQIHQLAQQGSQHITVLPYFLFAGAITDTIARKIGEMGDRYPHLTIDLGQPIGNCAEIVPLLVRHLTTPPYISDTEALVRK